MTKFKNCRVIDHQVREKITILKRSRLLGSSKFKLSHELPQTMRFNLSSLGFKKTTKFRKCWTSRTISCRRKNNSYRIIGFWLQRASSQILKIFKTNFSCKNRAQARDKSAQFQIIRRLRQSKTINL